MISKHCSKVIATAKGFYHHFRETCPKVNWGSWIWAPYIPSARSVIIWRAIQGRLSTRDNLRHLTGVQPCEICLEGIESIDHLFVHCRFARFLWTRICEAFGVQTRQVYNFNDMILYLLSLQFSPQVSSSLEGGVCGLCLVHLEHS